MKRILLIVLAVGSMVLASTKTRAQSVSASLTSQFSNTTDSVQTGSLTKSLTTASGLKGYYKVVSVQFNATKVSGVVVGTAQLQGSLDGVNWYNIGSSFTLTDVASQSTRFQIVEYGEQYLRVQVVGSGTMFAIISASVLARKPL